MFTTFFLSSSSPDWKRWVSMFMSNDNMQEELETSYKSKIQTRWLRDSHTYDDLRLHSPTFLEANWFLIKYQIHEIVKLEQIERCVVDSCITWNRAWMVQKRRRRRDIFPTQWCFLSLYSSCTIWELSVTHTQSHAPEMRHTTYARMSAAVQSVMATLVGCSNMRCSSKSISSKVSFNFMFLFGANRYFRNWINLKIEQKVAATWAVVFVAAVRFKR